MFKVSQMSPHIKYKSYQEVGMRGHCDFVMVQLVCIIGVLAANWKFLQHKYQYTPVDTLGALKW